MTTFAVTLEPLDPLLFGDNRSARAGEDHWRTDHDPLPATLYGALGARIAAVHGVERAGDWKRVEAALGPFSPDPDAAAGADERAQLLGFAACDVAGRAWFPKPAHLRIDGDESPKAHGLLLPDQDEAAGFLSSLPDGLRPLMPTTEREPSDESELDWLAGEPLLRRVLTGAEELKDLTLQGLLCRPDELYLPEVRLGLGVENAKNTAREGHLFSRPYRRFRTGLSGASDAPFRSAGYVAWYRTRGGGPDEPGGWDGVGFLGGDRRRVQLRYSPIAASAGKEGSRPLADLLREVTKAAEAPSRGYFSYLLTPALASDGPLPIAPLTGEVLVGAALGKTRHASGWFRARSEQGPRAMKTLLPAGSVFFYEWGARTTPEARREWIESRWMESVSPLTPCTGMGRALIGVWR